MFMNAILIVTCGGARPLEVAPEDAMGATNGCLSRDSYETATKFGRPLAHGVSDLVLWSIVACSFKSDHPPRPLAYSCVEVLTQTANLPNLHALLTRSQQSRICCFLGRSLMNGNPPQTWFTLPGTRPAHRHPDRLSAPAPPIHPDQLSVFPPS